MKTKILYYDCEIISCIRTKENIPDSKYLWCDSWKAFDGMGISVIGTWRNFDTWNPFGTYEAFTNKECEYSGFSMLPQMQKFIKLIAKADRIIGFNSIAFDDQLLKANKIEIHTDIDLLCQVRMAAGMPPRYVKGVTRAGYSLDNLAQANLKKGKTGTGTLAPQLWQDGKYKEVVSYCLNDVKLTKKLYEMFIKGYLKDPTTEEYLKP